jgi:hypothetical protein
MTIAVNKENHLGLRCFLNISPVIVNLIPYVFTFKASERSAKPISRSKSSCSQVLSPVGQDRESVSFVARVSIDWQSRQRIAGDNNARLQILRSVFSKYLGLPCIQPVPADGSTFSLHLSRAPKLGLSKSGCCR